MTYVPNAFDFALAAAMFAGALVEVRLLIACREAEVRYADGSHARSRAYLFLICYQWLLVGAVASLWIAGGRPWSALLLGAGNPWRYSGGAALAAAYAGFLIYQRRVVLARPKALEHVRLGLGSSASFVPHTPSERNVWTYAAMTAGICEEVLFRGFLFAFVAAYGGAIVAALIGSVLFGLYHANQGAAAILKTGAIGLLLMLIALGSGSLVPVIIMHVAQDLIIGDMGYHALSRTRGSLV